MIVDEFMRPERDSNRVQRIQLRRVRNIDFEFERRAFPVFDRERQRRFSVGRDGLVIQENGHAVFRRFAAVFDDFQRDAPVLRGDDGVELGLVAVRRGRRRG